jgi:16S rRNA (guanine(1405)-N(7))-methyltransferase
VANAVVARIGQAELQKRRSLKVAIKETKDKLHQVAGAYQDKMRYTEWQRQLPNADLKTWCLDVMRYHASTRERLPYLADFYRTIFAELGAVRSILDVACGLNPLAVPWMPVATHIEYTALDIYEDMANFIAAFFAHADIKAHALACDVIGAISTPYSPLTQNYDAALLLKTMPCLEQSEKGIGTRLLDILRARSIVVSYPLQSLGGKCKGMAQNYNAQFQRLVSGKPWRVQRLEFENELVFIIRKENDRSD